MFNEKAPAVRAGALEEVVAGARFGAYLEVKLSRH
jgi:hypothetical protein